LAGAVRETLFFAETIENALPLNEWLRREPPASDRRRVTRRLAQMIRRLHVAGFSHRDLKAPNILVAPADGPGARPYLVDLDGLRALRWVSPRRRARNLMRLSVSLDEWGVARQTDRLRFLRAYLGRRGGPAPITVLGRQRGTPEPARRLRRWWERIARLSRRKLNALRRKGSLPVSP
jgi:tRNA A-37 threonylcarbamoyl transferase component Bud32